MAVSLEPAPLEPMEARSQDDLPEGPGWQFEPKWDGFRCLALRRAGRVDLRAKSGKPLGRYFPDIVEGLDALHERDFLLDGELAIAVGTSLSFEALQLRLHPAESRVRKLAAQSPAFLIAFDLLRLGERDLSTSPLRARRSELERFHHRHSGSSVLRLSPATQNRATARRWLAKVGGAIDGVVAKRLDEPYAPGERAMIKVKRLRSADCVVGGFRRERGSKLVASILLGLYDEAGLLHHVGFVSALAETDKPALTKKLERLVGSSAFSGRAPGAPSRWSRERSSEWTPLRPELVVEVRYDHATGDRLRHGATVLRWRPDKAARQCGLDQLGHEARPGVLVRGLLRA